MGERRAKDYEELLKEQQEKRKARGKSRSEIRKERYKKAQAEEKLLEKTVVVEKEKKTPRKIRPPRTRQTQRYREAKAKIDSQKEYEIDEALELLPQVSLSKFEGSCEVHIQINPKVKKGQDPGLRGLVTLPHGSGKKPKVVILDEKILPKIEQGWTDFDIALATPQMMPKIAKVAKILGPKGKMPNPKAGTVVENPEKRKKELESGLVEYRTDRQNVIHLNLGKLSWPKEKLKENYLALIAALPKNRIASVHLAPTIGPSIKVKV